MSDILTPADEQEDPLSQLVGRVSHHDGRVKVAALHKHPEEVGDHKVVVNGGNEPTPGLRTEEGQPYYYKIQSRRWRRR